nr:Eco57I restriction-modification methylase domain-containing protein [Flaviflexus equikiangi]
MHLLDGDEQVVSTITSIIGAGLPSEHPFHWFLEFPEIFGDGRKGFDAVLGNPPYINAVEMYSGASPTALKKYYSGHFATAVGSYDLFVLFYERAMTIAAKDAAIGLLIPNKVLSAEYAEMLRRKIAATSTIHSLIDFSTAGAFSASVYPVALITTMSLSDRECEVLEASGAIRSVASQSSLRTAPRHLWSFLLTDFPALLGTALSASVDLGDHFEVSASATVSEAYDLARFVNSNPDAVIPLGHARFIVSGNVRRFVTSWIDSPVRYLKERYTFASVPLSELPSKRRVQTESAKLIISGMSKRPTAFLDEQGEYCAGVSTVIVLQPNEGGMSLKVLEQVLNSRIAALIYLGLYAGLALAGGYLRFGSPQIATFPIPAELTKITDSHVELDDELLARLYGVDPEAVSAAFASHFSEKDQTEPGDEPPVRE